MTFLLFSIAAGLGILRILGYVGAAFQAVAHLYVGGLFGAYFAAPRPLYLALALALATLETACFLLGVGR